MTGPPDPSIPPADAQAPCDRHSSPDTNTVAAALFAYRRLSAQMETGDRRAAEQGYAELLGQTTDPKIRALICNDLGVLASIDENLELAESRFREAIQFDADCEAAKTNLAELQLPELTTAQHRDSEASFPTQLASSATEPIERTFTEPAPQRVRIAILSFLFNWPSTGGGIVHTVELIKFLAAAGYDVKHFHVRYSPWGIGEVTTATQFVSEVLSFEPQDWQVASIQRRFRAAVDAFNPDYVIITDSWNFKPLLAEAVRDYPYFLRLQALECLCPLNNVRLIPEPEGRFRQCALHQLATPAECGQCVQRRGRFSGSLHQAERALCAVGSAEYQAILLRAFAEAEAVLVVNPLAEAMVSPFAKQVRVVTAGMDPGRFPWPAPREESLRIPGRMSVLFAGITEEWMKGFHVLREACALLWQKRQDFEVIATGNSTVPAEPYIRYVGWQSQDDLPRYLSACDMLVMPTIAQEALGRTAVEAMAAGRPVVASRIGGLPFTVAEGATGLLCEPGDPIDLARKIEILLDSPSLREQFGLAGRQRFEEHYAWPVIVERHYRTLLKPRADRSRPLSSNSNVQSGKPEAVLSNGASAAVVQHKTIASNARQQPEGAIVQIVGPRDQWVLERLARKLAMKLPYAEFVLSKPRPSSSTRLAYYVNYALYGGPSGHIDVGFFTHYDADHQFLERARQIHFCISMSRKYADWLSSQGIRNVAHIPMGFDAYRYRPRLILGVVGLLDHERKGKRLVDRLRALPFVEVIATEGRMPDAQIRDLYQRVDYVLIPATVEGGPMSLLEALGVGKPVIAPRDVGIVPEFADSDQISLYPAGNFEALERIVLACYLKKSQCSQLVANRTWDDWAQAHHELFMDLLTKRGYSLPAPAPGFRFGLMGQLDLPWDTDLEPLENVVDQASAHLFYGRHSQARETLAAIVPKYECVRHLLQSFP
jgi:glycosyltransferase involved in cell wall biosynthesis